MKHMGDDGDMEILKKMDSMLKVLREKEGELEDLEALNQTLIVKERKSNDELQEARKELISVSVSFVSVITYYLILTIFLFEQLQTWKTKRSFSTLDGLTRSGKKCALRCNDQVGFCHLLCCKVVLLTIYH